MPDGALNNVNDTAQDLANQEGVAYQELPLSPQEEPTPAPTPVAPPPTPVTAGAPGATALAEAPTVLQEEVPTYLERATTTVAGQLETLLGAESPYIQQARQQAMEYAQQRGLLSTTLAAQAGQEAAIGAALPIAQADAARFAQAEQSALARQHEVALQEANLSANKELQQMSIEATQRENEANRVFQQTLETSRQEHEGKILELQNTLNVGMQEMKNQQETMINQMRLDAQEASDLRIAAHNVMTNYQNNITKLLSDPTFLELSGADINTTVANLRNMAKNQISFLGSMSQVDLSQFLKAAFPTVTF